MTNIPEGDFSFIKCKDSREMLTTAYHAISSIIDGWEFLKNYNPPPAEGFMFSEPPQKLNDINKAINNEYDDHTGYTYGWTMRQMEYIVKKGWNSYVDRHRPKYQITWTMPNGYSGHGDPMFKSFDEASELVKARMVYDDMNGWKIKYKIESV